VYRAGDNHLWYLAVAATYVLPEPETASRCNPAASDRGTAIALKNTESRSLPTQELGRLKLRYGAGSLHFVDAFLWNGSVYFPYYPYNYTSGAATGWPSMARIAQSTEVLFQGQAALDCGHGHPDGRRLLLSSSLVEALDIWAGVFSAATGEGQEKRSPATTALCLFRMSEIQARAKSCSWDFETTQHNCVSPVPWAPRRALPPGCRSRGREGRGRGRGTRVTFTKSQVHIATGHLRPRAQSAAPKGRV
jgi:plexin C